MPDPRTTITAHMKSLITGFFGCYDAAAETCNARWGGGASKGTISRKIAGSYEWTIADVIALEDAAGRYPITRMLARRVDGTHRPSGNGYEDAGSISKEAGEAVQALLSATQSACAGERAQAIKELTDVKDAADAAIARLEAAQ
jgi:hypothetical protein